jgi:GMP synthase PP-ATPase subunit
VDAVIRAVDTRDVMTAMPTQVPFKVLHSLGKDLSRIPKIGNVHYEITTKPSSTVELE